MTLNDLERCNGVIWRIRVATGRTVYKFTFAISSPACYCGQTAGCIKMPLGVEVGLSPGDFVLDGDPAPSAKRGGAPNFCPTSIVAKWLHGSRRHLVWR